LPHPILGLNDVKAMPGSISVLSLGSSIKIARKRHRKPNGAKQKRLNNDKYKIIIYWFIFY